ncbi:type II toxin-antitoxin system RelE/ParE family toxin [Candidatus Curtissbacteria bacterium]|nr:type II toxin-antitoxin system RelE/ParE family toxin [Candidatus Curtissbacteria bacterium]
MDFGIYFYKDVDGKSPVEEFLLDLAKTNIDLVVKTRSGIEKLRKRAYHREPLSKYVEPGLWELRIKSGNNILRILYTFEKGRVIILLHVFIKKQQKIPSNELELARKRLREIKIKES